jgi:hypothetical protein
MKEQKKYHQRKLAIIEMIEECEKRIAKEKAFMDKLGGWRVAQVAMDNSLNNISRLNKIGAYLTIRYHE